MGRKAIFYEQGGRGLKVDNVTHVKDEGGPGADPGIIKFAPLADPVANFPDGAIRRISDVYRKKAIFYANTDEECTVGAILQAITRLLRKIELFRPTASLNYFLEVPDYSEVVKSRLRGSKLDEDDVEELPIRARAEIITNFGA